MNFEHLWNPGLKVKHILVTIAGILECMGDYSISHGVWSDISIYIQNGHKCSDDEEDTRQPEYIC